MVTFLLCLALISAGAFGMAAVLWRLEVDARRDAERSRENYRRKWLQAVGAEEYATQTVPLYPRRRGK